MISHLTAAAAEDLAFGASPDDALATVRPEGTGRETAYSAAEI